MSFEELKRTFTITYGMAGAVIMGLFFVFQSWVAVQNTVNDYEVLRNRMDTRHDRLVKDIERHEEQIRELELNHDKE